MHMVPNDRPLRLSEAAQQLNVSYWALRDWCKAGKVRHRRVGKFLIVMQSEIVRILENGLDSPADA